MYICIYTSNEWSATGRCRIQSPYWPVWDANSDINKDIWKMFQMKHGHDLNITRWPTSTAGFLLQCMCGKWIQAALRVQRHSHFNWWAGQLRPRLWRILGDDPSSSGARLQMHSSERVRTWHRCCDVLSHRRCETWLQTARSWKSEPRNCSTGNDRRTISHCLISSQPRGKRYGNSHTLSRAWRCYCTPSCIKVIITTLEKNPFKQIWGPTGTEWMQMGQCQSKHWILGNITFLLCFTALHSLKCLNVFPFVRLSHLR